MFIQHDGETYNDSELIAILNEALATAEIEPEAADTIITDFRRRLDDLV